MDLGYGFVKGRNTVSKQKVCYWKHTREDITWKAFLWYIAEYIEIENYGEDWVNIYIWTVKQRELFYKKVLEYDEENGKHNYEIDKTNELWKDHKRNAEKNSEILQRLCDE